MQLSLKLELYRYPSLSIANLLHLFIILRTVSVSAPSGGSIPAPLTRVKCKPEVISAKRDLRSGREVEDITLGSPDFSARLIGDPEVAVEDDLHLVVGVVVDERYASRMISLHTNHLPCHASCEGDVPFSCR